MTLRRRPNPRYQVQPGNEILEPLALVENGESSPAGGFPAVGDWRTRRVQDLSVDKSSV
ncbi:hypothetical protein [Scytonema sp. HK-05]|uniref:hypothetical protein n=1 Tax=Scytonema sp. HK-05 TaxID=1137095 RepID=UPI001300DF83|nr:hypothetical protein [Scytonema sp. HK-05]